MAKYDQLNREAEGPFIYRDEKGRSIYCSPFMKNGYVIPKHEVRAYTLYSARFVLAFSIGALLYLFFDNLYLGIAVGLVSYVVLALLFHLKFLKGMKKIANFERPKKEGYFERNMREQDFGQIAFVALLSLAFVIGLLYNLYVMKFKGIELAVYCLLIAAAAVYLVLNVILFFKKKAYIKAKKK